VVERDCYQAVASLRILPIHSKDLHKPIMASGSSVHHLSKPPDFEPKNGCADLLNFGEKVPLQKAQ
ncbi:MAG TPA: hypothetical protein VGZ73_11115, partial [Bryobacteraceae bacterium]|nr:hypothetical protein [Bryobacteraceae bacterium]